MALNTKKIIIVTVVVVAAAVAMVAVACQAISEIIYGNIFN